MLKWFHRRCEKYLARQTYRFMTSKPNGFQDRWFRIVSRVEFKLRKYLYG